MMALVPGAVTDTLIAGTGVGGTGAAGPGTTAAPSRRTSTARLIERPAVSDAVTVIWFSPIASGTDVICH